MVISRIREPLQRRSLTAFAIASCSGDPDRRNPSASCVFGWILTAEQIPVRAATIISMIVPNKIAAILLVNLLFLAVGMFMDGTASIIILTPILVPLMNSYGMNLVHFGVIMTVNVMIGLLTPPVGMVVLVLSFVPELVLFLPKILGAL